MNKILKKIDEAGHIVVVSHLNPDADSIGSASAMYTFLLQKHKKVSWFCKTKNINPKLAFIPWFDKIRDSFASSADLAILLDCADKKRAGIEIECDTINIDHHESNDNFAELNLVTTDAISTTEVLYNFFKSNEIKINKKMATAIYAGLIDDSDGFLSDRVDGTTFALAKELIDYGADFELCNENIIKRASLAALRLKAVMLTNMYLEHDAKVAFFYVSIEDMKSTGAINEDCEAALEESLYLPHVEVAMLLRQNSDYTIKGSIRSKAGINSAKIATVFGGGGHSSRAGFNIYDVTDLKDLKNRVLNLIKKEM